MKLWILSQDSEAIHQATTCFYSSSGNLHTLKIKNSGNIAEMVGKYSSKKRCLELISEISQKLLRAKTDNVIFKMPKD